MGQNRAWLVLGLDTGGTFTDAVLYDTQNQSILRTAKTPTTHFHYGVCIENAIHALKLSTLERQALLRIHLSTTLATNAVAEQQLSPAALLLEAGDVRPPTHLHANLLTLNSCMDFDGRTIIPVSGAEILTKTATLAPKVTAFAVSGYASTRNPAHEQAIAAVLRQTYQKPVVLGCQLSNRLNFFQRARAAALNASLLPVILDWLQSVRLILQRQNIQIPLYVVKGDGSLMSEKQAAEQPVQTLLCGPAASLRGGAWLCRQEPAVVVVDVGGTTTDIGHAQKGEGHLRNGGMEINGEQIAVDGLDMHTHALGGDSGLRVVGNRQFMFGPVRCLPFCRVCEWSGPEWLEVLEAEVETFWHFGDIELLRFVIVPPNAKKACSAALTEYAQSMPADSVVQTALQTLKKALFAGPQRLAKLTNQGGGAARKVLKGALQMLLTKRVLIRVAFTPTDLACLQNQASQFDQPTAQRILAIYAKVLEMNPLQLLGHLLNALQNQAMQTLARFFLLQHQGNPSNNSPLPKAVWPLLAEHLCMDASLETNIKKTRLQMHPYSPLAMVGAGAQAVFCHLPSWLKPHVHFPRHREAANAVGAAVSRFLIRQHASVEPVKNNDRFVLYTHQAPQTHRCLADAMQSAKDVLRQHMMQRAHDLGLQNIAFKLDEEILEDHEAFTRKTRKVFLMARVWALLEADPPTASHHTQSAIK